MQKRYSRSLVVLVIVMAFLLVSVQAQALDTEIGETEISLNGQRQHVRTQETNLGNLITDILREYTGADIAVYNGGGIRDSAELGPLTLEDAMEILAFQNEVVTLEMTGIQILDMLEFAVSSYPEISGKFLQVSGLRFYFDPSEPAGERVKDVRINGNSLRYTRTYTVATNEFLAAGGDDYTMMEEAPVLDEHEMIDTNMFIEYIENNSPLFPVVEGRIVVIN